MTTDRNNPDLNRIVDDPFSPRFGQQETYLILSEEERAKGFVRPVRQKYKHLKCGSVTTMGLAIAETYARDPSFYGGTMCVNCQTHFRLKNEDGTPAFLWEPDGSPVGD